MNRIERAVTAAVEGSGVEAGTAVAPYATAVVVSGAGSTDATVTGGLGICVIGSTHKPVLECLRHAGDVEGMSAAELLRTRHEAL